MRVFNDFDVVVRPSCCFVCVRVLLCTSEFLRASEFFVSIPSCVRVTCCVRPSLLCASAFFVRARVCFVCVRVCCARPKLRPSLVLCAPEFGSELFVCASDVFVRACAHKFCRVYFQSDFQMISNKLSPLWKYTQKLGHAQQTNWDAHKEQNSGARNSKLGCRLGRTQHKTRTHENNSDAHTRNNLGRTRKKLGRAQQNISDTNSDAHNTKLGRKLGLTQNNLGRTQESLDASTKYANGRNGRNPPRMCVQ